MKVTVVIDCPLFCDYNRAPRCLFLECVARTPSPEVHVIQVPLYIQEAGSFSATQLLSTLARMIPQEDALAVQTHY